MCGGQQVRSDIEAQCTLIAEGRARMEDVVTHALDVFERKCVGGCAWNELNLNLRA